ncbi:Bicarbonate transporter BicA [Aliiroseovarius sp. xm-m-379]|uniref:SulP family inorganic anion transporter n=1 Tax=unclassified Aliiroseovarius TaxID=2623558 RepID=UPI00156870BB|nr:MULTISPECIES: SulP family inorganic anion transporter [unclassified Aliiroseovarius]NRP12558.1 Bicarbonate transporter BicA [Aliiroseovarius sp. xm-d-517]NRP26219.1 Bicarbonate transporter BicA [Aliiroseovarius sp. xm-m-379]NRP31786.1 Bicarbonate transporter BicA [Aliiroseovarius sp. xm-m-314]NRP35018.1 Bicarbonate transporter BicA [Aliiroseovarius sp. xm-a-104]NRP42511.1 Bicarbonate transporter BicA [Aliiroseovarius sp. xm-m-339-2]
MPRALLARYAARIERPDLRLSPSVALTPSRLKTEILSGLTVALALVPEAVAFAFVAGVHPLVGLYAAFMVGLITALIGGRPGMISGATGALAVVMVALVADHGVEYLFATVVLMGLLQIFAGVMHWGKFIRLVPHPVMLGFVNGLAIVIFLAQLTQFKQPGNPDAWLAGTQLYMMLGLVGLTMLIIWGLPKITSIIPAPLAGIGIVAGVVIAFGINVPTVGDMASIKGGLPSFHWMFGEGEGLYGTMLAPFTLETLWIILPYAVILAAIGLIESLLTLNLVGEMTGQRGGASQECIAQGTSNVVTGFFGGMGGCAMIGQSMINVKSGGRTRIAGIAAALFLLLFIVAASSWIEMIPLAALVGVMFMVVIGTFAWNSVRILTKVPRLDAFVIILVTGVTVYEDLAVAVVVGVIVSALAFAWQNASHIHARTRVDEDGHRKVYEIEGPLFFGSVDGFLELFDVENDPEIVVLEFAESRVVDQSALQAIEAIAAKYEAAGKSIQLRHLSRDCHKLLNKAGHLMVDSDDDPDYEIAVDYSVKTGILGGH